jgi:outer membrane protein assembly factor BamE (lipoprotein component of BamABCDE complex)
MIPISLRAVSFAAMAVLSVPHVVVAQRPTIATLARRIDSLEKRVRELEAIVAAQPTKDGKAAAAPNWRDIQNWRRLRRGMTMDQVRELLGEPSRVIGGRITIWQWDSASVEFLDDIVASWSEPRQ